MQNVLPKSFALWNKFFAKSNFNVKKLKMFCVVALLMDNMKYCCYISIKKFAICDI